MSKLLKCQNVIKMLSSVKMSKCQNGKISTIMLKFVKLSSYCAPCALVLSNNLDITFTIVQLVLTCTDIEVVETLIYVTNPALAVCKNPPISEFPKKDLNVNKLSIICIRERLRINY